MKTRSSGLIGVVLLVALMGTVPPASSARNAGDVRPDISITTLPTTITQDFNTLPASGSATWTNNSTLPGWYHARTGTGTTIVANDGASNTGNLYAYGTGTSIERALGSVGSGTAGDMFWGILLTNNTGATINTLDVSYTGEQWRNSAAAAQTVAFSYLIGTGLTGSLAEFQGAGVPVPSLDFTSPITGGTAAALDGNLAANRVVRTFTITGLGVANGQDIILRWSDIDHTGVDHGLAIDDFSVTASSTGGPTPTPSPTATPTPSATPAPIRIRDIQGAAHLSPLVAQTVANVPGIVTAKVSNGFYLQDPSPDANDATSEGIFVFTSTAPTVNVGDAVLVGGMVAEFRSGGSGSTNLTGTEITSPTVSLQSTGNPLPAPIVIGTGGRIPPNTVIEDDAAGSVETSGVFDLSTDGIDFYESLEGMRVQVNNAVVVGPRSDQGEIPVLSDNGANASIRTTRGGIVVRATDFNPERIILDDLILATPVVNVGDHFSGPAIGVMDYSFGNFKLLITQSLTAVPGGLTRETTLIPTANQLAVATFNVENLDPGDPPAQFTGLASLIVNNLRSPDIIAVEEIQDNNGPTDNGVVDATTTYNTLILAIQTAGGPTYAFRQINPVNDQDGGEPGGNIRVGFLFRSDRGLAFTDRAGGCSTCATTVANGPSGVELSFSPGRVDPTNTAFNNSRKPLAGEFTFNGQKLFLIANHFSSKGGDDPLFGRFQPPVLSSEVQRTQQAQVVNNFVDSILALNANAKIVALGDLNDFSFSTPINTLKGGVLHALIETLPQSERYTYVFEGNSQDLDHILLSDGLFSGLFNYDVVHVNSEFADQISDHDPQIVRLTLAGGPTPTPTATPATPTPTPATPTPTVTPPPTPTATATASPTPTCPPGPWTAAAPALNPVARYASVKVGEDLYVISGVTFGGVTNAVRRYNPTTNVWTPLANIPVGSEAPAAVFLDGRIYVVDGLGGGNLLRIYDPVSNIWSNGPARPGVVDSYGAVAFVNNGKIFVIGCGSGCVSPTVSIYDPGTNLWTAAPNAPANFQLGGYTQIGQFLYLIGSYTATPGVNSTVSMRLDLTGGGGWSVGPVWTPARADFALAAYGTKLVAIGGDANGGGFFDPSTNVHELETSTWPAGAWVPSLPNLPSPLQGNRAGFFSTGRVGGEIWSTGGIGPGMDYLTQNLFRATTSCGPTPTPTASPTCPPGVMEGFDDITALPALGWVQTNHSTTIGTTGWFQGNSAIFPAHQGVPGSYIAANFNNTTGANTISNWLLTPPTTLASGTPMTFWTRTTTGNPFPDRLQVRMSTAGASTNVGTTATDVGDFTTLLLDINPTYTVGGYPEVWTLQTVTIFLPPGPPSVTGRLAFRYFVENGGPTGANSNYIGIDTFHFVIPCDIFPTPTIPPTPTPPPTVTPTATATATATAAPSATATIAPSPSPSATPSASPSPSATPPTQAINLSTRMRVQTGNNAGIGGLIITGSAPKQVLLRAIGPSLIQFGVPGVLADPVMELHGPGAFATITNNNWRDTQETEIQATGIPPTDDLESAILVTLNPGAYTAIVRGNNDTSGVGLIEIYDLNRAAASKLANLSTRAFVSTGSDVVIAGFLLGDGNPSDRIVVRGIGPSLAPNSFPVSAVLADPTLDLRDANAALLIANNDWQDDTAQAALLIAYGLAPTNNLESGIATTLPSGLYTAILAGLNNGTGIGLVEVYDLGP